MCAAKPFFVAERGMCMDATLHDGAGRDSLSGEGQLILPGQHERGRQDRPSKLIMPGMDKMDGINSACACILHVHHAEGLYGA